MGPPSTDSRKVCAVQQIRCPNARTNTPFFGTLRFPPKSDQAAFDQQNFQFMLDPYFWTMAPLLAWELLATGFPWPRIPQSGTAMDTNRVTVCDSPAWLGKALGGRRIPGTCHAWWVFNITTTTATVLFINVSTLAVVIAAATAVALITVFALLMLPLLHFSSFPYHRRRHLYRHSFTAVVEHLTGFVVLDYSLQAADKCVLFSDFAAKMTAPAGN